jgi:hypothetical protein
MFSRRGPARLSRLPINTSISTHDHVTQDASMASSSDPTDAIRKEAVTFPGVAKGTSCNQSSFKAGKGTFLFIGPGPRGQGYKAMFKLKDSLAQARQLAADQPSRFEVGSTGWVTARFTNEQPLPRRIWATWLTESYELTCGGSMSPTRAARPARRKQASLDP